MSALCALVLGAACGDGAGAPTTDPDANPPSDAVGDTDRDHAVGPDDRFIVAGVAAGVRGDGLSLALGSETLATAGDGPFTFTSALEAGAAYAVTVATHPTAPAQTCTVAAGEGVVTTHVTAVRVGCVTDRFSVGGTVQGAKGPGLVLALNGDATLPVADDGPFVFPEPIEDGATFAVTVGSHPPGQLCVVSNGLGALAGADVTSVSVACADAAPSQAASPSAAPSRASPPPA